MDTQPKIVLPPQIQETTPPSVIVHPPTDLNADTRVLWCFKCEAHRRHTKSDEYYQCDICQETQLRMAIFDWKD